MDGIPHGIWLRLQRAESNNCDGNDDDDRNRIRRCAPTGLDDNGTG